MSKNASVKKPKRRLKRSVRRSLAAVLMITAIGVAAVPVPENLADNGTGEGTSLTASRAADAHADYHYVAAENGVNYESYVNTINLSRYYNESNPNDLSKIIAAMSSTGEGRVFPSLNIVDQGSGQWDLGWQFMFYETKNPKSNETQGVICKYNSQYRAEKVDLELTPTTEYYTVDPNKFDAYFDANGKTVTDASGNVSTIMTHAQGKAGMDNDPCDEVTYTYQDYLDGATPSSQAGQKAKAFFEKYYKEAYDAKVKEFSDYTTQKAAYDALTDKTGAVKPTQPKDLTVKPSDVLTTEQRLTYYCDHDKGLAPIGSGYTLVSVIDSRLPEMKNVTSTGASTGNSEYIYVAKGGTPISAQHPNDSNGFCIVEQGRKMCAIGEGAFYGVGNVDVLTIPQQIGYIGNDAFTNSFIKEIEIVSVDQIGNRAFKNCTQLAKVTINSGTYIIGAECFENSAVTSITLPYTVATIGYGAFANCKALTTLDLNGVTNPCRVKEAAFYNCTALTEIKMDKSAITTLGKAAFAVESGATPIGITMPEGMTTTKSYKDAIGENIQIGTGTGANVVPSIGDYLFAGRSSLEYVVFPKDYGRTTVQTVSLPLNMFHGCVNLKYIEFPVDIEKDPYACGYVEFDDKNDKNLDNKKLFSDIINPDFYVRGPELNSAREDAFPRESTWYEKTQINDFVPYVFKNASGVDCYEVKIDNYRYQANEKGELTSCVLVDKTKTDGNLVIPDKVGNYEIKSIVDGCFADPDLRNSIQTIVIKDNSITEIQDSAFKDLPNLTKVTIGNSVSKIGNSAFEGCKFLEDVTFHTPQAGHEGFTIGDKAFQTGGDKLTFHGDIVKGYAPFEWAMQSDNVIRENGGIRVCYKSLSPTYLTVMYNPNTNMVTLLDYPKYSQISDVLNESHADEIKEGKYASYEDMMEKRAYAECNTIYYNDHRIAFAQAWNTITLMPDSTPEQQKAKSDAKEALYTSNDYGPWVNNHKWYDSAGNEYEGFVSHWQDWVNGAPTSITASIDNQENSSLIDWLFEPIVAYAVDNPEAYFIRNPYDVANNAESGDVYRAPTEEERLLVNATKNIVIPDGIQSIDVYGYVNGYNGELNPDGTPKKGEFDNGENLRTYFINKNWDANARKMYTGRGTDEIDDTAIVPGLFSGTYDDNCTEIHKRGNDRIETVTMSSVEYLPDYAFDSCERLGKVVLGEACADIGTAPFRGCTYLTDVSNNAWYETINGIVYSKNKEEDGTTDSGTYTIEECLSARGRLIGQSEVASSYDANVDSVSVIKPGAFEACEDITLVDFSAMTNLTDIPKDCFRNCDDLSRISLPRTVNNIEAGAFENDEKLIELTIPGKEVFISARAFKDNIDGTKSQTAVFTYPDSSARRYVDTYGAQDKYNLRYTEIKAEWRVIFLGPDGEQIGEAQYVKDGDYANVPEEDLSTEKWTHEGWIGSNNTSTQDRIYSDTIFIAKGSYANGMVNGKWTVDFYDGVTGEAFWPTQYVEDGEAAEAPPYVPAHEGYTFLDKYSEDFSKVTKNMAIIALYGPSGAGNPGGVTSGGTTNTSGGGTNTNTSNRSSNTTTTSGGSTSSTSSSGAAARHTVTVVNGYGSGSYAVGETVIIVADVPDGQKFKQWRTESNGVNLVMVLASATTFVMPDNNVLVTAEFEGGTTTPANTLVPVGTGSVSTNPGTTPTNTPANNGGTRVDITKPGISNKDLATANVNGSTDNFIVKISETPEATQAVINALTNKYGNLDDILYYAMDISLYDSTGITKITDTTGLTVDITIPLPDALVTYGGNNMMGAVVSDQLEDMSERFTTINGVPCISFTATHFSPYTIYVNTQNLSEGLLDVTPKTGDPIHPKWFLSIGLACLSIILFMKKDKKVKVKTA